MARVRIRPGLGAVLWACMLACATPVNYYASPGPVLPAQPEIVRAQLAPLVEARVVESGIESITVREGETLYTVSRVDPVTGDLTTLPIDALTALLWIASEDLRGAEFDLLVREQGDAPRSRMVTARHDVEARIEILLGGPPRALSSHAPDSAELEKRFRIGPLLDGSIAWQPSERIALAEALSLLTTDELAYLRFLPFRRESSGSDARHAGYYTSGEAGFAGGLVVLLDRAFAEDADVFVGTPERAYPQSVSVILHELGHAIARLDRERLVASLERDRDKYNQLVKVFNQYVEALNARYVLLRRDLRITDRRKLEAETSKMERTQRKLRDILRDARARLNEMAELASGPSPIETAYLRLPNARRGPTPYGSTAPAEGFAEAFALYHLDPESLSRFSPEVHDWFARGAHISAALFPPLEDVPPPEADASVGEGASPGR